MLYMSQKCTRKRAATWGINKAICYAMSAARQLMAKIGGPGGHQRVFNRELLQRGPSMRRPISNPSGESGAGGTDWFTRPCWATPYAICPSQVSGRVRVWTCFMDQRWRRCGPRTENLNLTRNVKHILTFINNGEHGYNLHHKNYIYMTITQVYIFSN